MVSVMVLFTTTTTAITTIVTVKTTTMCQAKLGTDGASLIRILSVVSGLMLIAVTVSVTTIVITAITTMITVKITTVCQPKLDMYGASLVSMLSVVRACADCRAYDGFDRECPPRQGLAATTAQTATQLTPRSKYCRHCTRSSRSWILGRVWTLNLSRGQGIASLTNG